MRALPVLAGADLIICAVDNPRARLAVSRAASLFLKPLLDLGTRIEHKNRTGNSGSNRSMWADIRLIGDPGRACLQCFGGLGTSSVLSPPGPRDGATTDPTDPTRFGTESRAWAANGRASGQGPSRRSTVWQSTLASGCWRISLLA